MDPDFVRRLIIVGMFSDDSLLEQLVLKGGNALHLVHQIGNRSSLDIDLSLEGDFANAETSKQQMLISLRKRFEAKGLHMFDERFEEVGGGAGDDAGKSWGGYQLTFKVIELLRYEQLGMDLSKAQMQSLTSGPNQERTFTVQISKFEYCTGKTEAQFDQYTIYVYTPAMIAFEKLRAICQQMPEYKQRKKRTARSRDFYDIAEITLWENVDFKAPENLELVSQIFAAKAVPLDLIPRIRDHREFHRQDWPQVQNAVSLKLKDFDFYFDFVVRQADLLEPLWMK
jgi:predicted nucleotidyltransferase component of viral defense system